MKGKKPVIDRESMEKVLLDHSKNLIRGNSVVPKTDEIWKVVAQKIQNSKPETLYSYVVNDRFNLKKILFGRAISPEVNANDSVNDNREPVMLQNPVKNVNFSMPKEEFNQLICDVMRQCAPTRIKKVKIQR